MAGSIPQVDHVHFYGFYIGNYPALERDKILRLCELLNGCRLTSRERVAA